MTDLDKLIEAVEGGNWAISTYPDDHRYFEDDLIKASRLSLGTGDHAFILHRAYHGSLDAAKALHEALLPGWTRDVDATAPECGITVTLHKPYSPHRSPDDMGTVSSDMACEARAWLIAILKAYRSTL